MTIIQHPCLIRGVRAEFGELGNMSPHPIRYDRWMFARAEMLFQALRFAPDSPVWKLLLSESNPMKSKFIAKSHVADMCIAPRSKQDVAHMRTVLRLKTSQYPEIRDLAMSTGDRQIIEDCSKRRTESGLFWGAALQDDGTWSGTNMLGVLWMDERQRLRDEYEKDVEDVARSLGE